MHTNDAQWYPANAFFFLFKHSYMIVCIAMTAQVYIVKCILTAWQSDYLKATAKETNCARLCKRQNASLLCLGQINCMSHARRLGMWNLKR